METRGHHADENIFSSLVTRSKGWSSLEAALNQTPSNLKRWSACCWTMMSWRRSVSAELPPTNPQDLLRIIKVFQALHFVSSCSTSKTRGEEAARGVQQGEGAQKKEGEVCWEGNSNLKHHLREAKKEATRDEADGLRWGVMRKTFVKQPQTGDEGRLCPEGGPVQSQDQTFWNAV